MASRLSPSYGTCQWILREDVNTWVSVMVALQLLMCEQKHWQLWMFETWLWSHVFVGLIWYLVISPCFGLPWNYRDWQSVPAVAIAILDPLHKLGGEQHRPVTKISLYFIVTLCRNLWICPHCSTHRGCKVYSVVVCICCGRHVKRGIVSLSCLPSLDGVLVCLSGRVIFNF